MLIKKATIAALLAAAGMAASSASMAQQAAQETGWYVGGSLGQMEADGDCPAGFSCDLKDSSWKIFGGYRINRNFAAEAFYMNWGEISVTLGPLTSRGEMTSFGIAALGIIPLGQQFELFGKLGFASTDQEFNLASDSSGTELLFGVGAIYNFTRNFGIRAEWERANDSEVNNLSIGLQYRF